MHWFQGTYTTRYNRRHHLAGHLFQGRYKALLADSHGSGYPQTVRSYLRLKPVRAHIVGIQEVCVVQPAGGM